MQDDDRWEEFPESLHSQLDKKLKHNQTQLKLCGQYRHPSAEAMERKDRASNFQAMELVERKLRLKFQHQQAEAPRPTVKEAPIPIWSRGAEAPLPTVKEAPTPIFNQASGGEAPLPTFKKLRLQFSTKLREGKLRLQFSTKLREGKLRFQECNYQYGMERKLRFQVSLSTTMERKLRFQVSLSTTMERKLRFQRSKNVSINMKLRFRSDIFGLYFVHK